MKVVILAGGYGTRLSEETDIKPKPMLEIGGKPILWHIMKMYSHYGHNEFIVCLGYKGFVIKEYFHHYYLHQSNVTLDLGNNSVAYHDPKAESWKVTLIDTGQHTMTGGRIKRIRDYVGGGPFMLTYGDGVGDVDIPSLLDRHRKCKAWATVTAVQPSGRFGAMEIDDADAVRVFQEKPQGDGSWINGGFFVLEPQVFDYIDGDDSVWERDPLERLAQDGKLSAYRHRGFWKPMDTLRDKLELENLWQQGKAKWKLWND